MAKHCIKCKREIADNQAICYICGASQNVAGIYIRNILLVGILVAAGSALGYWQSKKIIHDSQQLNAEEIKQISAKAQQEVQQIEEKLNQTVQQLSELQLASSKSTQSDNLLQQELISAKNKADQAVKRSLWLSKENSRFKIRIKELSDRLALSNQALNNQQQTDKQLTLEKQLKDLREQQQIQMNSIKKIESELENKWQQKIASGNLPTEAEKIQHQNAIILATEKEKDTLASINSKIDSIKKSLSTAN